MICINSFCRFLGKLMLKKWHREFRMNAYELALGKETELLRGTQPTCLHRLPRDIASVVASFEPIAAGHLDKLCRDAFQHAHDARPLRRRVVNLRCAAIGYKVLRWLPALAFAGFALSLVSGPFVYCCADRNRWDEHEDVKVPSQKVATISLALSLLIWGIVLAFDLLLSVGGCRAARSRLSPTVWVLRILSKPWQWRTHAMLWLLLSCLIFWFWGSSRPFSSSSSLAKAEVLASWIGAVWLVLMAQWWTWSSRTLRLAHLAAIVLLVAPFVVESTLVAGSGRVTDKPDVLRGSLALSSSILLSVLMGLAMRASAADASRLSLATDVIPWIAFGGFLLNTFYFAHGFILLNPNAVSVNTCPARTCVELRTVESPGLADSVFVDATNPAALGLLADWHSAVPVGRWTHLTYALSILPHDYQCAIDEANSSSSSTTLPPPFIDDSVSLLPKWWLTSLNLLSPCLLRDEGVMGNESSVIVHEAWSTHSFRSMLPEREAETSTVPVFLVHRADNQAAWEIHGEVWMRDDFSVPGLEVRFVPDFKPREYFWCLMGLPTAIAWLVCAFLALYHHVDAS